MNDYVMNTQQNPLYVLTTERLLAAKNGNCYSTGDSATSLAASGYFAFRMKNPLGSKKLIFINDVYVTINAATSQDIAGSLVLYQNADLGTPAVATAYNTNFGSSNTTAAQCQSQSSASSNPVSGGTIIGTVTQVGALYANVYGGSLILQPNQSATLSIRNLLTKASNVIIKVNYWEQKI